MDTVDGAADLGNSVEDLRTRNTGIAGKFIEWNYFYVLSAVLMMLGCFMLMRSPVIDGTKFARTLKTLLILQGYELLLIVTAVIIVKRLRILDDALTLLLLEMVLLLDPTFFSNSFFTMKTVESTTVNAVCFLLVPVKLVILQRALRLSLTPRMFGAFLAACSVVFLFEGPLNFEKPPLGRNAYYYLFAWMPLVVAFLLPPMKRMANVCTDRDGYITDAQRALLPRFLMVAPVAIAAAHFVESSHIYTVRYYPMHTVPLLMALAVLTIHNTEPTAEWKTRASRCLALDVLCLFIVFLSIPFKAVTGKAAAIFSYTGPHPWFVLGMTPILIAVAVAVAAYLYFYAKLDYRPALYRIAGIAVVGGGYMLARIMLPSVRSLAEKLVPLAAAGAAETPDWLWNHLTKPGILVCAVLLVLAVKARKSWTLYLFGGATACWFLNIIPYSLYESMPRLPECVLALVLVFDHLFYKPENNHRRTAIAAGILVIGLFRYWEAPANWTLAIAAVEVVGLVVAGYRLNHPGYTVAALAGGAALTFAGIKKNGIRFHPSVLILMGGMASFLVGIFVTFYKQQILGWLETALVAVEPTPSGFPGDDLFVDLTPPKAIHPDEEPPPVEPDPLEEQAEPPEDIPPEPPEEIPKEPEAKREPPENPAPPEPETEPESDDEIVDPRSSTDAPRIVSAKDADPDTMARIIAATEIRPDDTMLICVRQGASVEDWFAILTRDRLIVR